MPIAGPTLERPIKLASLLEVGLKTKLNEPALVSQEWKWSWRELDHCRFAPVPFTIIAPLLNGITLILRTI